MSRVLVLGETHKRMQKCKKISVKVVQCMTPDHLVHIHLYVDQFVNLLKVNFK